MIQEIIGSCSVGGGGGGGGMENWKIGRLEDRREGQPTRSQCPRLRNLEGQNPGAEGV